MKVKIVIKVEMKSEKHRVKAKKVAATARGVESLSIQGNRQDKLVVEGEGVDPVCLTVALRKKVGRSQLLSVEEVMERQYYSSNRDVQTHDKMMMKKKINNKDSHYNGFSRKPAAADYNYNYNYNSYGDYHAGFSYPHCQQFHVYGVPMVDPNYPSSCSIM